jgi:hypothetical protein
LDLALRSAFGTSHSATSNRSNALVVISIDGLTGLGEAGLPPKKPGCYEADIHDCALFMEAVIQRFGDLEASSVTLHDPFLHSPSPFFAAFRRCLPPASCARAGEGQQVTDERVAEYLGGRVRAESSTTRGACVALLRAW